MRRLELGELRAPALVVALDLLDGGSGVRSIDVSRHDAVWCLARSEDVPLGVTCWDVRDTESIEADALRSRLRELFPAADPRLMLPPASGPDLTVALCTRERPADLRRALASLAAQSDLDFGVVMVDNAPASTATREVFDDFVRPGWSYLVEPAPGLSRARNAALNAVSTSVVAWMDDDETADRSWVRRIREGFNHPSAPTAVSGLMLPAELETEAQVRFEQYGGFNKGHGFAVEELSVANRTVRSPMYPLPSFGAGGNMAFHTEALRRAGGFDPYLGAGTATRGGEETRAFALILRAGGTVLHWPAAITWHYHRRELAELQEQFKGYSAGLSAFITSMLLSAPAASSAELLRMVPTAIRHVRPGRGNRRIGHLPADFPKELVRAGRAGFLDGGISYLRERRRG